MPKRKQKKYTKPRRPFDKIRIEEENVLVKKYGLKNKREIWKAESAVNKIRGQAKMLLTKTREEQEKFIKNLRERGFKICNIADALSLGKEDYLKRRIQSIVVEKGLTTTAKQARQFIVHKHVAIGGKIVNIPSYLVPISEEDKIELKVVKKEKKEDRGIAKLAEESKERKIEERGEENAQN